ncbi:helix-turn-helix transcriptional regulator [Shimia biformata]|uniref:helix-turn-helix transcriptional regulator n=1 Tax=Shimia biformata TaxID=1294299 RepID=UPI001EF2E424|nr:AlpA family phage regulatory protein [Shimia biformata]
MSPTKIDPNNALRDMFDFETEIKVSQGDRERPSKAPPAGRRKRRKQPAASSKYLSVKAVAHRFGVHKATIWRWFANNPDFPEPVKLSAKTTRWREEDLEEYERRLARAAKCRAQEANSKTGAKP